ncbi:hypothetical protein PF003_g20015 [Phytophthora fragariae]|uniref:Uncharacterized protein n=1 Tax=Phytophthora fragariae TaxID=53985 RepID=A0A6A3DJ12_9STRA|nr:hypothetical protein PF003_g20015 [Phytophthora fragariae]KAE8919687.1 hypothetical protein PF009_g30010 [Phytophthora fragariae]
MGNVKQAAKNALAYAKRKGLITDAVDAGERFLHTKAIKPEHHDLIATVREGVRVRFGVGVASKRKGKFAKGSPEMKAKMAALRARRKSGGSFTL